ncbi:MAG: ABC transporter ATP-binding protein [Microbacterium sp.]|uniref:ABC transporter ATP-binding protein n=1 Tax=Microbacterium sp. TaxID=51671 RepID=UPI0039E33F5E
MIEVDGVGVEHGGTTLLAPVSARVDRGESLVVRGRNGAGKSTLLRVLAGMRRPTTGAARIGGERVSQRDQGFRRRVAAMIGMPPLAPDLTVFDHVLLVAATWHDKVRARDVARDVLAEFELAALGQRFPHELSSGQTQLFGLALVLARPFDVLILDEPEQRLDPEHLETVVRALRARLEAGATLVVATHSATLADRVGDRTLLLDAA